MVDSHEPDILLRHIQCFLVPCSILVLQIFDIFFVPSVQCTRNSLSGIWEDRRMLKITAPEKLDSHAKTHGWLPRTGYTFQTHTMFDCAMFYLVIQLLIFFSYHQCSTGAHKALIIGAMGKTWLWGLVETNMAILLDAALNRKWLCPVRNQ